MKREDYLRKCFLNVSDFDQFCKKKHTEQSELRHGINEEAADLLDEYTKLVIVWTAIPQNLPFFFTGKNTSVYNWMDESELHTALKPLAKRGNVPAIKEELKRLHIAFLDATNLFYTKLGSSRDADIKALLIDEQHLGLLKRLKDTKVYSATRFAQYVLDSIGVENEYKQFFNAPKKAWIELFNNLKK